MMADGLTITAAYKFITMICGITYVTMTGMRLHYALCVMHLGLELKDRCLALITTKSSFHMKCIVMGMKLNLYNASISVGVAVLVKTLVEYSVHCKVGSV